jgi:hypothetical protein
VYQQRKNANEGKGDAVFKQLNYQFSCECQPTCKEKCDRPKPIWTNKPKH